MKRACLFLVFVVACSGEIIEHPPTGGDSAGGGGDPGATDQTSPSITARTPAPDATGVPLDTDVTVFFDEPLDCATVHAGSVILQAAAIIPAQVSCTNAVDSATVVLDPTGTLLTQNTLHVVSLLPEIADVAGNTIAVTTWQFRTADSTPFTVDTYPPLVGATPATVTGTKPAGSSIRVDSSERVAPGPATTWSVDLTLAEGPNSFAIDAMVSGTPTPAVTVTVTLDTTAPSFTSRAPGLDEPAAPTNTNVIAVLDEPLDCATVTGSSFELYDQTPTKVSAQVDCTNTATTGTIQLDPDADLAATTIYDVTVSAAITDAIGNPVPVEAWQFTSAAGTDTTPPNKPTAVQPSTPTLEVDVTVTGSKDADANVEARWQVDAALVQDWYEIVANDGSTGWSTTLPLQVGDNDYAFRSRDQANNVSTTPHNTISVTRDAAVLPPTVNYAATTTVDRQVLSGTKEANTAILIDDVVVVPNNAATTWDAIVPHDSNPSDGSFPRLSSSSSNDFAVEARDQAMRLSTSVNISIDYTPPPPVAAGELLIELELQSVWDYIGDEMRIRNLATPTWDRVNIDAYSIEAWVEGPFTIMDDNGTATILTDDTHEQCVFDGAPVHQRKYTRLVKTLYHNNHWVALTDGNPDNDNGFWADPNYFAPNWAAALIESGRYANATFPMPPNEDRRDANGHHFLPDEWGGAGQCPPTWRVNSTWCTPKFSQTPAIDGVTEATLSPFYGVKDWCSTFPNTPCTGGPDITNAPTSEWGIARRGNGAGLGLGEWKESWSLAWDLNDSDSGGNLVRRGAYLITVQISIDRSWIGGGSLPQQQPQWPDLRAQDVETCWDDPAHDLQGPHRAEGIVVLDGQTPQTFYWLEKGLPETVDACRTNKHQSISCAGAVDWDLNRTPGNVAAEDTATVPNSNTGAAVKFLTPDAFNDGSSDFPVRVRYCPDGPVTGACP